MKQIGTVAFRDAASWPPCKYDRNDFSVGESDPDRAAVPGQKFESQNSGALIFVKTAFCRSSK